MSSPGKNCHSNRLRCPDDFLAVFLIRMRAFYAGIIRHFCVVLIELRWFSMMLHLSALTFIDVSDRSKKLMAGNELNCKAAINRVNKTCTWVPLGIY